MVYLDDLFAEVEEVAQRRSEAKGIDNLVRWGITGIDILEICCCQRIERRRGYRRGGAPGGAGVVRVEGYANRVSKLAVQHATGRDLRGGVGVGDVATRLFREREERLVFLFVNLGDPHRATQ